MKNKIVIAFLLSFGLLIALPQLTAAQTERVPVSDDVVKLDALPEIGKRLPIPRHRIDQSMTFFVTGSGSLQPSLEVRFNGIDLTVAFDRKSRKVAFISTNDRRFRTEDGLKVGDTLQSVREAAEGEVRKEAGWAFYLKLKSGWYAAFVQGKELTEGELAPEAKVSFFFKR